MKIDVRFRGLEPSAALRDHAVRRFHFHLSRIGHEISLVQVRISDVNGPKGGVDKQCQITVRGKRLPDIVIDARSSDVYSAVDMAVERVSQVVGRDLKRVRGARTLFPMPRSAS